MGIPGAKVAVAGRVPSQRDKTKELLAVRDLSVRYAIDGLEFNALDGVSFDIAAGEIVGLLGESGCGKTTTALSLLCLAPSTGRVTSGSILFNGRDLLLLNESHLRKIRGAELAIIYQDSSVLNPVLRAGDQVSEVLRAHQRCTSQVARERVYEIFAAIGLDNPERIYKAYPHQLSGGQRQRIAIAQALICKPRLVVADEPTASVDTGTAYQILDCFKRMKESFGTSFLVISHDPATLAAAAGRIMVMYAGQIVESTPTFDIALDNDSNGRPDIRERPRHPYTRALLDCAPQTVAQRGLKFRPRRLPTIPGSVPNPLEVIPGCSFASRCQDRMAICGSSKPGTIDASNSSSVRCFKYEVR